MSAMAVASSLALLSIVMPPISIVSSAAVALVTLRRGANEGLLVLLSSSVASAALGIVVMGDYQFAVAYALILWTPVWLLSIVLREGKHLSLALEIAAVIGVLAILGFYLFIPNPAEYWQEILAVMIEPMRQAQDIPLQQLEATVSTVAKYMTGILAAGSVTGLLLGLLLARWWQSKLYNPGGFKAEYLSLQMSQRFTLATLLVILIAFLTSDGISEVAANIGVILFMLYSFVGMAIVHSLISVMKAKRFLLPLFYLLVFVIPHIVLPVAIIGLTDTWLNLRKNIKPPTSAD
ncbi:MAG: DUF2232 domain-containing protein [Methyloprofundus sp.]|nr:DUF2232 domain-containing protein [Methyloprofundus sp.]